MFRSFQLNEALNAILYIKLDGVLKGGQMYTSND